MITDATLQEARSLKPNSPPEQFLPGPNVVHSELALSYTKGEQSIDCLARPHVSPGKCCYSGHVAHNDLYSWSHALQSLPVAELVLPLSVLPGQLEREQFGTASAEVPAGQPDSLACTRIPPSSNNPSVPLLMKQLVPNDFSARFSILARCRRAGGKAGRGV